MKHFRLCIISWAMCTALGAAETTQLFILSGQSNMAKMDEAAFQAAIDAYMPQHTNLVVKSALGGQAINRWLQDDDVTDGEAGAADAPKSKGTSGDLYVALRSAVAKALGERRPISVTFCWMQGERDAKARNSAAYGPALRKLITRLRTDLGVEDLKVVIGRLSDHKAGDREWDAVRAIQVEVAAEYGGAWVDTDDLNDGGKKENDLHYTGNGYKVFARRLAAQAYALLAGKEPAADGRPDLSGGDGQGGDDQEPARESQEPAQDAGRRQERDGRDREPDRAPGPRQDQDDQEGLARIAHSATTLLYNGYHIRNL